MTTGLARPRVAPTGDGAAVAVAPSGGFVADLLQEVQAEPLELEAAPGGGGADTFVDNGGPVLQVTQVF
ncbi:MAG TPA: hypothetical protein VGD09_05210, partial [Blastococcus sp.]